MTLECHALVIFSSVNTRCGETIAFVACSGDQCRVYSLTTTLDR
jgi:hypothetical protein